MPRLLLAGYVFSRSLQPLDNSIATHCPAGNALWQVPVAVQELKLDGSCVEVDVCVQLIRCCTHQIRLCVLMGWTTLLLY